jgi:hypothetical protein
VAQPSRSAQARIRWGLEDMQEAFIRGEAEAIVPLTVEPGESFAARRKPPRKRCLRGGFSD